MKLNCISPNRSLTSGGPGLDDSCERRLRDAAHFFKICVRQNRRGDMTTKESDEQVCANHASE